MPNPADTIAKVGVKRVLTGLGLLVVALLAVAFILGILSLRYTRDIVSDDFQQQQLILARTTARQIEDGMAFLRRELKILGYSPAIQYLEDVAWANRMRVSFDELARMGVVAISRIDFQEDRAGKAYTLDGDGSHIVEQDFTAAPEVIWARDPENRGRIYQSDIQVQQRGNFRTPFMTLATPVYEESVDESHPKPTGRLDGVLMFKVDVSKFTGNYCGPIRSGRTGYCWVLNIDGIFLYHPEREFIGDDAFVARGRRNPVIKFDQINEIQKTKMLAGEEGTAQYVSGWHRGDIREMEKFLAYAQAHIGLDCPYTMLNRGTLETHERRPGCTTIWPVAVVAPIDEVYGTIHSLYVRQFLIQGILIFALICVAMGIIYYELRWSRELEREVDRTTQDLKRSREQYKSVVENARDFIFSMDGKGVFINVNTAASRAFGLPARAMAGKRLEEVLLPDDAAAMLVYLKDALNSGQSFEIKAPLRIRDRVYWLSTHFIPLFGEDGRTAERVLIMARDITDRKRMEEQMAQTEKLASLGTLAAGVAHEINNPLGIMVGFTELLLDRIPPETKDHELLKTIERQGLTLKKIVENLMTFARQPAKHEEYTDVNEDVENVLRLVQNTLFTKKIEVETRLGKGLPRVRADSSELQQVFLNLINNAAAAMPEGGRLTVVTKINPYSHMVEAILADTGTGIPREIADRIFDPFFTTKKVGEGTGLGLAVSYAIVHKYGGNIRFETRADKEAKGGPTGTTFFVSLQPAAVRTVGAEGERRAAGGGGS